MPSSENFDPKRVKTQENKLFGIRASLKPNDSFGHLLGDDWDTVRWYATELERDKVLKEIGSRHVYSRIGDEPALIYEAVESSR